MLAAVMAVSNMQTSVFAFDMSVASSPGNEDTEEERADITEELLVSGATAGIEPLAEESQAESLEEMPEGESQTESAEMIQEDIFESGEEDLMENSDIGFSDGEETFPQEGETWEPDTGENPQEVPSTENGVEFEQEAEEETPETEEIFSSGSAQDLKIDASGQCGDNMSWEITGRTLYIKGTGDMYEFGAGMPGWGPWGVYKHLYDTIQISSGITSIGKKAFYACGVAEIKIPETVTKIGEDAFYNAGLSGHVEIPASVTQIGKGAFQQNSGITSATIKGNVTEIEPYAFYGCGALSAVNLSPQTKTIRESAFQNCGLTSVVLPESVETIEQRAFGGCGKLSSFYLPRSVRKLGHGVFFDTALYTVGSGEQNDLQICWSEGDNLPAAGFAGDSDLQKAYRNPFQKVTIPEGITEIPESFFSQCRDLKEVNIPDTITKIGESAFEHCKSLSSMMLSDSVTCIGDHAFANSGLTSLILPDSVTEFGESVFIRCENLEKITLPSGLTTIPWETFNRCSSLKEIEWPENIQIIESRAFEESGIRSLTLPETVTTVKQYAFSGCKNLSTMVLPASLSKIEAKAFSGCTALLTAGPVGGNDNLQYSWTDKIPENAFYGAEIEAVTIPDSVTDIGDFALAWCQRLEVVSLPKELKFLPNGLFQSCKSLKILRLPEKIGTLGSQAFANCDSLEKLFFRGKAPQFYNDLFENDVLTAYYPASDSSWTKEVMKDYDGDVTWKPYEGGDPLTDVTERTVTICSGGKATARFYFCGEDGNVLPVQPFKYLRRDGEYVAEMDSPYLITDGDGSYCFETPYFSYQPGGKNEYDVDFEVELKDAEGITLKNKVYTIHVKVSPLTYTEEYYISLSGTAAVESLADLERGGMAKVSIEHESDGTEDITLEIEISSSIAGDLEKRLKKFEKPGQSGILSLSPSKLSNRSQKYYTYSAKINNFDSGIKEHREILAVYTILLQAVSAVYTNSNSVAVNLLLDNLPVNDSVYGQFKISEKGIKITADASAPSVKADFTGEDGVSILESYKLFSLGGTTTYSGSVSQEDGSKTVKSGIKSEKNFSVLSGGVLSIIGCSGFWGYKKLNDVSFSASADKNEVSFESCVFDSGFKDYLGDEIYSYRTYTAKDEAAKSLTTKNKKLNQLYQGTNAPVTTKDAAKAAEDFETCEQEIIFSDTQKKENEYKLSPSLKISDKLEIGFELGAVHGWKTEVANGISQSSVETVSVDSANNLKDASKAEDKVDLTSLLLNSLRGYGDILGDMLSTAAGLVGSGLKNGYAWIKDEAGNFVGWTVELVTFGKVSLKSAPSYRVATFAMENRNANEAVSAATVGSPCLVSLKNKEGASVNDFGDKPLTLALTYTEEELREAGASLKEAGQLAVYRYEEETGAYIYHESIVDADAKTVTASIYKPGQYVLVLDGAVPTVTDIEIENRGDSYAIGAVIRDLSGIQSITMLLDGNALADGSSFQKYYDKKTGKFSFEAKQLLAEGTHTVIFKVKDQKNQVSEIKEEFMVSSPGEYASVMVPAYTLAGLKAEFTASMKPVSGRTYDLTASVTAVDDQGETEFICPMEEENGVWRGSFKAEKGVYRYKVKIRATDENGTKTLSKTYTCEVSSNNTVSYEEGSTEYGFNLRTGVITKCRTSEKKLKIPEKIYGRTVTALGSSSFENLSLEEVNIPESVKRIDSYAFAYNDRLTTVQLPSGLYSLSSGIFKECTALKTISLPKKINSIEDNVFEGCISLTEILFPEGLEKLGRAAFSGCTSLNLAVFGKEIKTIGEGAFYGCGSNLVLKGYKYSCVEEYASKNNLKFESLGEADPSGSCGNNLRWALHEGLLTVSGTGGMDIWEYGRCSIHGSFCCLTPWHKYEDMITAVVLEEGVTGITDDSFYNADNLEIVTIPDSVSFIGNSAFNRYRVIIRANVESYAHQYAKENYIDFDPLSGAEGEYKGVSWKVSEGTLSLFGNGPIPEKIPEDNYRYPWDEYKDIVKKVVIGSGITKVASDMFGGFGILESAEIPASVTEIGNYSFGYPGEKFSIIGSEGSYAQDYAAQRGIAFFVPSTAVELNENDFYISVQDVEYNGSPQCPEVSVEYRNLKLLRDQDYMVSYENNTNPGTAGVTVTGKDRFRGSLTASFQITENKPHVHTWDKGRITTPSTCKDKGTKTFYCVDCGETRTEQLPLTNNHKYGSYRITKNPTVFVSGTKTRTCSVCRRTESISLQKLKPTIRLNVSSLKMQIGQKTTGVKVSGLAPGDSVKSWRSSNSRIVKVDRRGKMTAQNKTGKVTITVTLASGKRASFKVQVQKSPVTTSRIAGISKSITLKKGKKYGLKPVRSPFTAQDKIIYRSSNKKVATVSSSGIIAAKKAGTTVITVQSGRKKVTMRVTVPKTATTSLSRVPTSLTLKRGKTYRMKVRAVPSNSDYKVTYKSSNKRIAVVDAKGKITAKKKGTVKITVQSGKIKKIFTLKVQ